MKSCTTLSQAEMFLLQADALPSTPFAAQFGSQEFLRRREESLGRTVASTA